MTSENPDTPAPLLLPNRAMIAQELYITYRADIPNNHRAIELAEEATDKVLELLVKKNTPPQRRKR